ncbi:hypothetical protein [Krasilnikovia sp. MM14-A1259]|uniref:hypothetical protein n=1 Tax=Krasilnikovia sp. MM14-A1259 TaxID=3373539 RepID=UPI003821C93C
MADLVVIVPSRGRPEAAAALAATFADFCTADTLLTFAVDEDDPAVPAYSDLTRSWPQVRVGVADAPSTMVKTLNSAATLDARLDEPPFAIGFMGDDHRPRTRGWDATYLEALHELGTGIVYGNDLLQGHRLPTQCAMTSDIIRALGFMSPPELRHMYVDNFWRDLGKAAGCLRYLPDVIVEHRHPVAGKAQMDEGYLRVNAPAVYEADERAYAEYGRTRLAGHVAKVQALRG